MAALVHLGIGLTMGMMEFGLAMIVANLAFVPAATWRALLPDARPPALPVPRPSSPPPRTELA
jgi:hypothetical protein